MINTFVAIRDRLYTTPKCIYLDKALFFSSPRLYLCITLSSFYNAESIFKYGLSYIHSSCYYLVTLIHLQDKLNASNKSSLSVVSLFEIISVAEAVLNASINHTSSL